MAIPNRQIGWSQESNLLWEITKQMDRLTKVVYTAGTAVDPYTCYLEITTTGGGFPFDNVADYNNNFTWDTPFTSLVIVGDSIQRLYGGSGVTLGDAFNGNTNITSINDGCGVVTGIDSTTFPECINLTFVNLPAITSVPNSAFINCFSLPTISLPSVTSIGSNAFNTCVALVSASFPNAITAGNNAFEGCESLTSVSLPKLEELGSGAFINAIFTSISLPSLTYMDESPFNSITTLVSASLPKVTNISLEAFYGCTNLTSVLTPKVTYVGQSAFYNCTSLTNINLPLATYIGDQAFESCSVLSSINLPLATYIGNSAFSFCAALTTINFPAVTDLGGTPGDDGVFGLTTPGNIESITVPVALETIDGGDPDGDLQYAVSNNAGLIINYV